MSNDEEIKPAPHEDAEHIASSDDVRRVSLDHLTAIVPPVPEVELEEIEPVVEKEEQRLPWEERARISSVPHWKADAARIGRGWALGFEVTEAEFNQALHDAFNGRIG